MAVGMSGEFFINALSHVAPFLGGKGYAAGILTAIIIILPVSLYRFYTCFSKGSVMTIILAYKNGVYGDDMQVVNVFFTLGLWHGLEKLFRNKLYN